MREGARAAWSGAGVACSMAAAERDWLHVVCSVLIGAELEDYGAQLQSQVES